MTSDRKKPTAGFWITVAMLAVLGYPLSFGPACWLYNWKAVCGSTIPIAYYPIIWLSECCRLNGVTYRYATGGRCPAMFPAIGEDCQVVWCVDLPEREK
jgi:hypothetical protein